MKYHSIKWWHEAIKHQILHIIRNIICRKWLKISFGYTNADLITMSIIDNAMLYYKQLIHKYPEYRSIKKYIYAGEAYTLQQMTALEIHNKYNKQYSVFWTQKGALEDIIFLLDNGICPQVRINNVLNVPHFIAVKGYNMKTQQIIYDDPYGDPLLRYKLAYGYNVTESFKNFKKRTINSYYGISFPLLNTKKDLISNVKNRFNNNLYFLTREDHELTKDININSKVFQQYSEDGKLSIDLGEEAAGKFILLHANYSNIENDKIEEINIIDFLKSTQLK